MLFPGRPSRQGDLWKGGDDQTNRNRALAAEGGDLGGHSLTLAGHARACLSMLGGTFTKPPAGLGAAQWERENTALGKKRRSSLLPPHSSYLLMDSPLCLFPIIQQVPALVPVRQHSSQRLLSFFAPFQNFNLISFSCLHVFVWRAAEGDLWDAAFSIVLPLRQRPRLTAPACSRPQTPSLLAAARDSSGRVERHHSRGPPQSPSNGRRCFGVWPWWEQM